MSFHIKILWDVLFILSNEETFMDFIYKKLLQIASQYWSENTRHYKRGNILYWQGDQVEYLYIIQTGAIKVSSVSINGKIYTHGILGSGHLLGGTDFFLNGIYETTAEIIEETSLVVIPHENFQSIIMKDSNFSKIVMQELAWETKLYFSKAQELSFLDTQQRLKQSLVELAKEHGLKTDKGIEINIHITHEDIGELINANRTTITLCLQELKKLGYLMTEGRHITLIPIRHMEILDDLCESVISGKFRESTDWAKVAIEEGIDPLKALNALMSGMKEVDHRFAHGQVDLSDIMLSSISLKEALPIIETAIKNANICLNHVGKIVFGTVCGDVHDIGKTITMMLLKARGFEVIDIGVDVPVEKFVEAVEQYKPDILAMSALLTTTQMEMNKVIIELEKSGLKKMTKVMIGGFPITPRFANEIGADGYAKEARDGVEMAWNWCSEKNTKK